MYFIIIFIGNQFLKQNKKQYDIKIGLVCLYNLASAYHKQWNLDQCIPLVDKFVIMLKQTTKQEQTNGKSNYWYKMKHLLIKTQLQYCAILSQVGNHHKALRIAIQVSKSLKQFFIKGHNQICNLLSKIHRIDSKKSLSSSWESDTQFNPTKSQNNDKVQFATNVLNLAKQNISQLIKMQTYDQVIKQNFNKTCLQLIELKSKTYFWKDNPENNIRLLRKQLDQQKQTEWNVNDEKSQNGNQQRNLLGIKKPKSWIQQITIAEVMVMYPINYLEFAQKDNIVFQFNYRNLVQKIILVSVTYFSLAIELRFIETTEEKQKKQLSQTIINYAQKINLPKQVKQQKNQLKKSQVFHLKSIILLCKMVKQNSAFLNHLVMNYHKHYKQDLITIQEQSSMAQYSHIYDKRSKSSSLCLKKYQNQYILPQDDQNQNGTKNFSPSKFSRQSAYFEDYQNNIIYKNKSPKGKQNPLISFKKVNSNKRYFDISQDKSRKYVNSNSISTNQARTAKQASYARQSKYINQKQTLKDQTAIKISVGKVSTLGSPFKIKNQMDRSKDKSNQKQASLNKLYSMKSLQKKSFSTRDFYSFSLGKISMNSTTMKYKKRRGQKSPSKQKQNPKDLKQSNQLKKSDYKKKQKPIKIQKGPGKIKDKKREKLNNGLTLLKQSISNPNLKSGLIYNQYNTDSEYASIKEDRSKKVQKGIYKK